MIFSVIIKNMLEKNENIFYFDAHFHLADCIRDSRVKHGNDTTDELSLSGLTRQSVLKRDSRVKPGNDTMIEVL